MINSEKINVPANGIKGLKENWKNDVISGFIVFLLAMPMSLGIAKASGFPPSMGLLTAMIGGIVTVFFNVSELSIKGPAAGLITIASTAIIELNQMGDGWKIVCGAIVIMALLQIFLGLLKFGTLSDLFPHAAVHGMLAAIGLIIIAKQIPVLLGIHPDYYSEKAPLELYALIPDFIANARKHIAAIGVLSLLIMFFFPLLNILFLKKTPSAIIVLAISIPLAVIWNFKQSEPAYSLVHIGNFWQNLSINAEFSAIATFAFWKYVFMFLFVTSLESLLTVKAVETLDTYKRKSSYNGDLIGQGAGNFLSGLLGGLPMISEVVRSKTNIAFGAKTKWSNFFHGLFLFISMLWLIPLIEIIPNSALAAMLIFAGVKLAAPSEFINTYKVGKEQLIIFLTTLIITLAEDLLLGIFAGILVKIIFHLYYGASLKYLFKPVYEKTTNNNETIITVKEAAVFTNLIAYKKLLSNIDKKQKILIDFSQTKLIDNSFIDFIYHYEHEHQKNGSEFSITGMAKHIPLSKHKMATRVLKK